MCMHNSTNLHACVSLATILKNIYKHNFYILLNLNLDISYFIRRAWLIYDTFII